MPQCAMSESMEIESSNYDNVSAVSREMSGEEVEQQQPQKEEEEEQGVMIALDSPAVNIYIIHLGGGDNGSREHGVHLLLSNILDKRGTGELQDSCYWSRRSRM